VPCFECQNRAGRGLFSFVLFVAVSVCLAVCLLRVVFCVPCPCPGFCPCLCLCHLSQSQPLLLSLSLFLSLSLSFVLVYCAFLVSWCLVVCIGFGRRSVAATQMNAESSRSHSIFTIIIEVLFSLISSRLVSRLVLVSSRLVSSRLSLVSSRLVSSSLV
jgi:hypothetical protein